MEQNSEKKLNGLLVVVIILLAIIAVCEIHREVVGIEVSVELISEEENES